MLTDVFVEWKATIYPGCVAYGLFYFTEFAMTFRREYSTSVVSYPFFREQWCRISCCSKPSDALRIKPKCLFLCHTLNVESSVLEWLFLLGMYRYCLNWFMELVACFSCAISKTQRNTKRCNSTGGTKTKTRSGCENHNATRPKPLSATKAPFAFFASFYQLNAWKKPWWENLPN